MRLLRLLSTTRVLLFASVAGAAGAILYQQTGSSIEAHLAKCRQAFAAKNYRVARNEAREALHIEAER